MVTSEGTNSGTALVWVIYAPGGNGTGAQLRAYNPVPVNGTLQLVNSWPILRAVAEWSRCGASALTWGFG